MSDMKNCRKCEPYDRGYIPCDEHMPKSAEREASRKLVEAVEAYLRGEGFTKWDLHSALQKYSTTPGHSPEGKGDI